MSGRREAKSGPRAARRLWHHGALVVSGDTLSRESRKASHVRVADRRPQDPFRRLLSLAASGGRGVGGGRGRRGRRRAARAVTTPVDAERLEDFAEGSPGTGSVGRGAWAEADARVVAACGGAVVSALLTAGGARTRVRVRGRRRVVVLVAALLSTAILAEATADGAEETDAAEVGRRRHWRRAARAAHSEQKHGRAAGRSDTLALHSDSCATSSVAALL